MGEGPAPVAVLMAGGRGQRLRPLTDKVPKPLLRLGKSSVVERIIAALPQAGIEDVYLAVNYKADVFEERLGGGEALGVRLHYLRERMRLGTAGPLSLLGREVASPILVMNADIVTRLSFARLLDYHRQHGAAATVGGVEFVSRIPYAVLRTEGTRLVGIEEKPQTPVLCNAGIYVVEPEVLPLVPPDRALDMPDLLASVMAGGMAVAVFPIVERWFDIGSQEEFERVLLEFATGEEE